MFRLRVRKSFSCCNIHKLGLCFQYLKHDYLKLFCNIGLLSFKFLLNSINLLCLIILRFSGSSHLINTHNYNIIITDYITTAKGSVLFLLMSWEFSEILSSESVNSNKPEWCQNHWLNLFKDKPCLIHDVMG